MVVAVEVHEERNENPLQEVEGFHQNHNLQIIIEHVVDNCRNLGVLNQDLAVHEAERLQVHLSLDRSDIDAKHHLEGQHHNVLSGLRQFDAFLQIIQGYKHVI